MKPVRILINYGDQLIRPIIIAAARFLVNVTYGPGDITCGTWPMFSFLWAISQCFQITPLFTVGQPLSQPSKCCLLAFLSWPLSCTCELFCQNPILVSARFCLFTGAPTQTGVTISMVSPRTTRPSARLRIHDQRAQLHLLPLTVSLDQIGFHYSQSSSASWSTSVPIGINPS